MLTKEQIDAMVKDACRVETVFGAEVAAYIIDPSQVLDLCCHVKALACEVERLHAAIAEHRETTGWATSSRC